MTFERLLRRECGDGRREVWIRLRAVRLERRNVRLGKRRNILAVVSICESGACGCVPEVERLRLARVARAVKIRDEAAHVVAYLRGAGRCAKRGRRTRLRPE